jgi:predicted lysophospholipase L1 biosynthesis ABC-type transport system permease subunit
VVGEPIFALAWKALGFAPRQLAGVVAWQATVTAVVGVIVGIPVGIVLGRQLWTLFANLPGQIAARSRPRSYCEPSNGSRVMEAERCARATAKT